jgi:hypothetical protein
MCLSGPLRNDYLIASGPLPSPHNILKLLNTALQDGLPGVNSDRPRSTKPRRSARVFPDLRSLAWVDSKSITRLHPGEKIDARSTPQL